MAVIPLRARNRLHHPNQSFGARTRGASRRDAAIDDRLAALEPVTLAQLSCLVIAAEGLERLGSNARGVEGPRLAASVCARHTFGAAHRGWRGDACRTRPQSLL